MPDVRTMSSVKADLVALEPMRTSQNSPAAAGGSSPGPGNKPAGETLELRRTPMGRAAHKGSGVTRRME
jgi:hypothetical protein